MIKSLFGFLIIIIVLFIGTLNYSFTVQTPFLNVSNKIQTYYINSINYVQNTIDKHIQQTKTIEELKAKLEDYNKINLLLLAISHDLKDLYFKEKTDIENNIEIELTQAISYAKFSNFNQVWLNAKDLNSSKIYGLVYQNQVAGVVITKDKKPLALLNRDPKSTYAVYIGNIQAPGIAHGNNKKNIIVKYIPEWFKIKKGDEIVTSGLDNIFFYGLKVGKVVSIKSSQGYQNAIVEPYFKANKLNYFHIIKSVK